MLKVFYILVFCYILKKKRHNSWLEDIGLLFCSVHGLGILKFLAFKTLLVIFGFDSFNNLLNCANFLLQIKTAAQLEAAFGFLAAIASDSLKVNEFEEACGVGIIR